MEWKQLLKLHIEHLGVLETYEHILYSVLLPLFWLNESKINHIGVLVSVLELWDTSEGGVGTGQSCLLVVPYSVEKVNMHFFHLHELSFILFYYSKEDHVLRLCVFRKCT